MTKVVMLARTVLTPTGLEEASNLAYVRHRDEYGLVAAQADELAEFAGRNCYRSFDRPNPATRENKDYLNHIIGIGHESVLEHSSATFYIEASRSVLTELERHRHLSFSVVSQRYVDIHDLPAPYHNPPALRDIDESISDRIVEHLIENQFLYEDIVEYLQVVKDLPRKQAREAARAVLPNMISSPMVVTGNIRTWRHVIKLRYHEAADAEIRELAGMILRELRSIAPNQFSDIPDEPYSY